MDEWTQASEKRSGSPSGMHEHTSGGQPTENTSNYEDVKHGFEFRARVIATSASDASNGGWLYSLGKVQATMDGITFTSPRQITYIDLDAVEVIQYQKGKMESLLVIGIVLSFLGFVGMFAWGTTGFLLLIIGFFVAAVGYAKRGESLYVVTPNRNFQFKSINTGVTRRAANQLSKLKELRERREKERLATQIQAPRTGDMETDA